MAKKPTVATTDSKTKKTNSSDDEKLIERAKDLLEDYQSDNSDNIKRAEEAIEFRALKQWPDKIKRDREDQSQDGGPRPCPVLDKTNQYVRLVVNELRQNRAAIRIRPVDDVADPKIAEVYTGIIRHIEDASNALNAYATAGEHAVDGGFGYWRLLTEYCDPKSFDQEIRIKRIPNRFSVALGRHMEPDGSDAKEALIWEDMDLDAFKAAYPKAKADGFDQGDTWGDDEMVRVAEYMRIEEKTASIYLLADGSVLTDEELQQSGIDPSTAIQTRTTRLSTVKWSKMTAHEVLESRDMLGSYIPVIKVTGNELVMPDGKSRTSGMVEAAMDPQRLHNYAHAGFIEHVALAPRAPWVAPKEGIAGFEADYSQANRRNITVLPYNHTDEAGNPIPMPQRTPPAGIAPGWQQMLMNTEHGVEAAMGMYGPTVGAQSQEKSGIALKEQKSQGFDGNYHFADNLARSIQHCGRILLEWIPQVYDTTRVARMLGEDGTEIMAYLDPEQQDAVAERVDQTGRPMKSYNLNVGRYDVTVSTGPSYTAKRQEASDNMLQLVQSKPEMLNMIGDLVFKNLDFPGADSIAKRLRATVPPQLLEADGDQGDMVQQKAAQIAQAQQQLDQQARALFQKEQELQAAEQQLTAAAQNVSAQGAELGQQQAKLEALKREIDSGRRILSAEQGRFDAEVKLQQSNEDAFLKRYEIDKKYDQSLVSAAASVITTQQGKQPMTLEQAMLVLAEAVEGIRREQVPEIEPGAFVPAMQSVEETAETSAPTM